MTIKLLAVGDMHLGRQPSRLPEEIAGEGRNYGPAEAWKRAVDRAIKDEVDIVALAGDLVEQEDDYFEAYRDLRTGVERLAQEGISVVGVTGNHDVLVLPRLAAELPDFKLLGSKGAWEAFRFSNGREQLTIHGWSFPEKRVRHSPLAGHEFKRADGVNLGLLHCDRDQRDSNYAPVISAELQAAGLDGWLLGHIHRPDILNVPSPSGYLGSLSGLHPGEHGVRGPWLIEIRHSRIASVEQWPLAPIEWQRIDLDLTGIEHAEDARDRLLVAVREVERAFQERHHRPRALGLRLRLTGRTNHGTVAAKLLEGEGNIGSSHACHSFIETIILATRPEIDLEDLVQKRAGSYPALLAQRLLLLERPDDDPERGRMIEATRQQIRSTLDNHRWAAVENLDPHDGQIVDWLTDTGTRLLEGLLDQQRTEERG